MTQTVCTRPVSRPPASLWEARLIVALLAVWLSGCGEKSPEERLEQAGDALRSVEADIDSMSEQIESHEQALQRLRAQRRKARNQKRTLAERLEARATDVALFRAVQGQILEAPQLQEAAITVDVDEGIVVLRGLASTASQRSVAQRIARETPGINGLVNRIDVEEPASDEQD